MKTFSTLSSRAAVMASVVAASAVFIAAIVAFPLIKTAAQEQAQGALASQADMVHNIAIAPHDLDLDHDFGFGPPDNLDSPQRAMEGIVRYLQAQGIEVQAVVPGHGVPAALTQAQVRELAIGHSVSGRTCKDGRCVFLEARPVGQGTGILLLQPMSVLSSVTSDAIRRILTALLAGFGVAVVLGLWFAKRLTKPLADAAGAAHKLAAGERNIRIEPEGPIEISEIAIALNVLSDELSHSEGRQREFLLSVSHELRTPLTAIRGYAEAMVDGVVVAEEVTKVGGIIESESLRLERLVSDLLDLARTGAVDFQITPANMDLTQVISEAADVWQTRCAREGVLFTALTPNHSVPLFSDIGRVRQIIDNLLENALRVTPSGKPIILELTDLAVVEVRDGGPGISAADVAVAFEPGELYERYRSVRKVGTGFGLALVGRLANRLGARASAGHAPEGGACFRIEFASTPTA
ncbi:MAG: HAMP domain-containing histidine kinase [Actinomycetales bacterium]|nr:HAMP domain-containing histidine kinase [Actinomycetales bacterium]